MGKLQFKRSILRKANCHSPCHQLEFDVSQEFSQREHHCDRWRNCEGSTVSSVTLVYPADPILWLSGAEGAFRRGQVEEDLFQIALIGESILGWMIVEQASDYTLPSGARLYS